MQFVARDTPVPLVIFVELERTKTAQDPVTAIRVEKGKQLKIRALQEYHFVVRKIPIAAESIRLFKT